MSEGTMKKKNILVILSITLILTLSGCAKLMPQEVIDPTKTVGTEAYTGFDDVTEDYSDARVVEKGGIVCNMAKLVDGEANWNAFMEKVNAKEPCSIRVKQKSVELETFYRDLYYDGSKFRMIISVDPEKYDYTYEYLYDVKGRRAKNCRESRIVFLTNTKDANYEDIIGSIGVNEEDSKINYQLVFRHQ